jgi:hypothetical protein
VVVEDMASPKHQEDMVNPVYQQGMASPEYQEGSFLDFIAALDEGVVLVGISTQEVVQGGHDAGALMEWAEKEGHLTYLRSVWGYPWCHPHDSSS